MAKTINSITVRNASENLTAQVRLNQFDTKLPLKEEANPIYSIAFPTDLQVAQFICDAIFNQTQLVLPKVQKKFLGTKANMNPILIEK